MTGAERLAALVDGRDEMLIMRMKSGFAVMSATQFLEGYSLLLAYPEVCSLNDLSLEARMQFLHDMSLLGDAVMRVTDCKRVNYSIYGNLDPFLHAHVFPRYVNEPEQYRVIPPMNYPESVREAFDNRYHPAKHGWLQDNLRRQLVELLAHSSAHPIHGGHPGHSHSHGHGHEHS